MEINFDKEDLEKAKRSKEERKTNQEMPKNEEIAFHKGALNTLVGERNELVKMIQTVESIMNAHINRLRELGIRFEDNKQG